MPFLETSRLLLRPMRAEDVHALLKVFSDPLVIASFGVPAFDLPQMEAWLRRNLDHQDSHGFGLFTVIEKESGLIIGDCGLECLDVEGEPETELGYDLRSDFWNRGLATEAAGAVRDYALHTLKLPRLVSLIRVGNRPSERVSEKIGMRPVRETMRSGHLYRVYELRSDLNLIPAHRQAND